MNPMKTRKTRGTKKKTVAVFTRVPRIDLWPGFGHLLARIEAALPAPLRLLRHTNLIPSPDLPPESIKPPPAATHNQDSPLHLVWPYV